MDLAARMSDGISNKSGTLELIGAMEWLTAWILDRDMKGVKDLQVADAILKEMSKTILGFLKKERDWK